MKGRDEENRDKNLGLTYRDKFHEARYLRVETDLMIYGFKRIPTPRFKEFAGFIAHIDDHHDYGKMYVGEEGNNEAFDACKYPAIRLLAYETHTNKDSVYPFDENYINAFSEYTDLKQWEDRQKQFIMLIGLIHARALIPLLYNSKKTPYSHIADSVLLKGIEGNMINPTRLLNKELIVINQNKLYIISYSGKSFECLVNNTRKEIGTIEEYIKTLKGEVYILLEVKWDDRNIRTCVCMSGIAWDYNEDAQKYEIRVDTSFEVNVEYTYENYLLGTPFISQWTDDIKLIYNTRYNDIDVSTFPFFHEMHAAHDDVKQQSYIIQLQDALLKTIREVDKFWKNIYVYNYKIHETKEDDKYQIGPPIVKDVKDYIILTGLLSVESKEVNMLYASLLLEWISDISLKSPKLSYAMSTVLIELFESREYDRYMSDILINNELFKSALREYLKIDKNNIDTLLFYALYQMHKGRLMLFSLNKHIDFTYNNAFVTISARGLFNYTGKKEGSEEDEDNKKQIRLKIREIITGKSGKRPFNHLDIFSRFSIPTLIIQEILKKNK